MDINVNVLQWFTNFMIKTTFGGSVNNQIMSNQELAEESNKSIIRKFGK